MKVLVTGHKGFIGTILVPMLLEKGYDVVGLDSDFYRNCTYGEPPVEVPEIIKDVRDADASDVEGFDAIIHLAALSNDLLGNINPDLTMEINYKASVRLAELAKSAGVPRFLFSSSCSMYGAGGDDFLNESARFNPVTPYATIDCPGVGAGRRIVPAQRGIGPGRVLAIYAARPGQYCRRWYQRAASGRNCRIP